MAIELQDKLYTSAQVADVLGVSLRTLYRYMEDGRIESMKTASGRHRFTKEQILNFLEGGDDLGVQPSNNQPVGSTVGASRGQQPRNDFSFYSNDDLVANEDDRNGGNNKRYSDLDDDFVGNNIRDPRSNLNFASNNKKNQFETRDNTDNRFDNVEDDDFDDFNFDLSRDDYAPTAQPQRPSPTKNRFDDLNASYERPSRNLNREDYPLSRSMPEKETERAFGRGASYEEVPRGSVSQRRVDFAGSVRSADFQASRAQAPVKENLNVRYYKSDFNDLIDLAKRIKETAISKDLEYAFTLNAGLSLHYLIDPFTILHFYVNPEDLQIWKSSLGLVPVSNKSEANIGIFVNTDIVFIPTKEIGGFKVVEDKLLLKDLMRASEDNLVREFRQRIFDS